MAGKGLIADYYQTILGQVNKEKRQFFGNDGILVNVTLIGHIGRMRSVSLDQEIRVPTGSRNTDF